MVGVQVEVVEMRLKLVYHSEMLPLGDPVNEGFDLPEIEEILRRLEELGISCEIIDIRSMPDGELSNLYDEALLPAVYKKYQVRKVFGSNRRSGFLFGRAVPALLIYEPGKTYPSDVYPHRNGERTVTIRAFLRDLLKKMERVPVVKEKKEPNRALVERMNRLRKKIGAIDIPVSELIREGRRR
ncbi:MAG: hypothetical protein HYY65_04920 [Candidatus Tectomicrobia bacterium]|uniref:Uncharacterized protein n=1 Tax=Tectimicrobiota bacterium TaxID=2528274 RepID=A0A932GP49_UNCTE|nr:hypothetical protein [Candidatus Tectomicrobia bacterium]